MTLSRFEKLIKEVNPRLKIKHRSYGDVLGLFSDYHYILRMTKGELHLNGYRFRVVDKLNPSEYIDGNIQKRGRKHVLNILYNHRHIGYADRSRILWGISSRSS